MLLSNPHSITPSICPLIFQQIFPHKTPPLPSHTTLIFTIHQINKPPISHLINFNSSFFDIWGIEDEVWEETEAADSGDLAGVEGQVPVLQAIEEARAAGVGGAGGAEWVAGVRDGGGGVCVLVEQ